MWVCASLLGAVRAAIVNDVFAGGSNVNPRRVDRVAAAAESSAATSFHV